MEGSFLEGQQRSIHVPSAFWVDQDIHLGGWVEWVGGKNRIANKIGKRDARGG